MPVEDYLPEWEGLWEEVGHSEWLFFSRALERGWLTEADYNREMGFYGVDVPPQLETVTFDYERQDLSYYRRRYPDRWEADKDEPYYFVAKLYDEGLIPPEELEGLYEDAKILMAAREAVARGEEPLPVGALKAEPVRLETKLGGYFADAFKSALQAMWQWILEQIKALIDLVVSVVREPLETAWEGLKGQISKTALDLYNELTKAFGGHSPITPAEAPALAVRLYTNALIAGTSAQAIAGVIEIVHPLKNLGVAQLAALVGDFGDFRGLASNVIGPLYRNVLGRLMTYHFQNVHRPMIPDERLLIEFRSKREIDKKQFDEAMGYQGFSPEWTDIIERWQWKDPRMFEIIRLADVGLEQGPAPAAEMPWLKRFGVTGKRLKDWWLYRKFMRAGYEDVDLDVMVNFIHRREVAFALTYVRTAIRRNYRWGYLDDKELETWIDRLNLPEQAKEWIFWAGELDREYFYKQDLVAYYKTAFRQDVLDDDELLVSLVSMGLPAREANIIVRTEKVKKTPKPSRQRKKEREKATLDLQKKYVTLYTQQYRKDLITSEQLRHSLLAIDLSPDLAEVTVAIESAKKGQTWPG